MSALAGMRQAIGGGYRLAARPLGLRALGRAIDEGLPERLAVPVRCLLTGRFPARAREVRARIERRRKAIARLPDTFGFAHVNTPHGPARWPVARVIADSGPYVSGAWLAHVAAVPARWGTFLHMCAGVPASGTMLEIGTSAGISAAYLASGRGCARLMTIEGSPDLAAIARQTLADVGVDASVYNAVIDEGLDQILAELDLIGSGIDLVYLDAHHDEIASLHYVNRLLPRLRSGALVILDDIYLYEEMWRVWNHLRTMRGISVALNLGRFGVLTWSGGDTQAAQFDLSRFTGRWRVGGARRTMGPCARSSVG